MHINAVYLFVTEVIYMTSGHSPDAPAIGPVSHGPGVDHQLTSGLLEEEMILKQRNKHCKLGTL